MKLPVAARIVAGAAFKHAAKCAGNDGTRTITHLQSPLAPGYGIFLDIANIFCKKLLGFFESVDHPKDPNDDLTRNTEARLDPSGKVGGKTDLLRHELLFSIPSRKPMEEDVVTTDRACNILNFMVNSQTFLLVATWTLSPKESVSNSKRGLIIAL